MVEGLSDYKFDSCLKHVSCQMQYDGKILSFSSLHLSENGVQYLTILSCGFAAWSSTAKPWGWKPASKVININYPKILLHLLLVQGWRKILQEFSMECHFAVIKFYWFRWFMGRPVKEALRKSKKTFSQIKQKFHRFSYRFNSVLIKVSSLWSWLWCKKLWTRKGFPWKHNRNWSFSIGSLWLTLPTFEWKFYCHKHS